MKPQILLGLIGASAAMTIAAPAAGAQERYLGEVFMTGSNFCPRGTAMTDGQLLAISQNTALFSLLGTTYGGDGRTTFALPDLRGRFPVHPGSGPGLTQRRLGEKGGSEARTLTALNMPAHTHDVSTQAEGGAAQTGGGARGGRNGGRNGGANADHTGAAAGGEAVATQTGSAGGSQSVSVMNPYLGVQFCIVLQGLFPSRS